MARAKTLQHRPKHRTHWQTLFLKMLPSIEKHAHRAFRRWPPEAREDAVQEVIGNAAVAFARLVHQEKGERAYAGPLARYAIAQVRDGRRVGNRLRICDVLSGYAQRRKGFRVQTLHGFDSRSRYWLDTVAEDPHTPVPEQVAFRLDFPEWLKVQTIRNRRIAEALALGNTTNEVARQFQLSAPRISQLRQYFRQSWNEFHGEPVLVPV